MGPVICVLVALTSILRLTYAQSCYTMTGSLSGSKACNSTANTGACCNIDNGDICTTSGLCMRQDGIPGFLYQDECTDSNWGSSCPSFCEERVNTGWALVPCSDTPSPGTWCCRPPNTDTDCCSNSSAVMTTNVGTLMMSTVIEQVTATSGATFTSTGGAGLTTITVTASATSTPGKETCPKNNTVAVGAGVGASLGIALLASLAVLGWREKTRPRVQTSVDNAGRVTYEMDGTGRAIFEKGTAPAPR